MAKLTTKAALALISGVVWCEPDEEGTNGKLFSAATLEKSKEPLNWNVIQAQVHQFHR